MMSSRSSRRVGGRVGLCRDQSRAEDRPRESQPSGLRSESTSSACGTSAPSSLARTSALAWPTNASGACQRSMSRHAHQGQPLERAIGADEVLDEAVGRRHQQLGRRGVLGDAGRPSRRMAIRSPILIASSMSWVTKRIVLLDLGLQAQELVLQALAVDRVDGAEGLVHQHHARVRGKRSSDARPLLLAAGELGRVAVAEIRVEPDQARSARRRGPWFGRGPSPGGSAPSRCCRRSCGAGRARSAGSRSRSRAAARGRAVPHRAAADEDVALGDLRHSVDHAHRGGLAAARGADEDADLTRLDLQLSASTAGRSAPG